VFEWGMCESVDFKSWNQLMPSSFVVEIMKALMNKL
jgi:hypothetical protein